MKANTKLQGLLLKAINSTHHSDDLKSEAKYDFQVQKIYGFIRDSYHDSKSRNNTMNYYDYDANNDMGIYIRNTPNPYFAVVIQWELSDFTEFKKFCETYIEKSDLDIDCSTSNLEFFIATKNHKFGREVVKRIRVKYKLSNDPMFLTNALEGCTHTFFKGVANEMDKD